jgi:carlactone synthase/all-trans-10'-apo-beta-carotenal 13,14-cleaving dioxygenase
MCSSSDEYSSSWPSSDAAATAFGTAEAELRGSQGTIENGSLPTWLNGRYYRNGPGTYENGTEEGMLHLFDGYGMVAMIELDGKENRATITNSFVRSSAYSAFKNNGAMNWREFGTPKKIHSVVDKAKDVMETVGGAMGMGETKGVTDNASVHVIERNAGYDKQGNAMTELWAMTETVPGTFALDPASLETKKRVAFSDSLDGTLTTAHPSVSDDGTLFNLLSVPGKGFTVYRMANDGKNCREKIADVPHKRPLSPAWIHDFPATNEFAVVPEMPLYFNLASLTLGLDGTHLFMDWIPTDGTTLHVVNLDSRQEGSVDSVGDLEAFFVFHWANAYTEETENGTYLHLDACVYEDPDIVEHLLLNNIRKGEGGVRP